MADSINQDLQGWKIKKLHPPKQSAAVNYGYGYGNGTVRKFSLFYNGEKNQGEMGPIKIYTLDYDSLRARSWQAYLDSDVAQFVLNKFLTWTIGSGLKLQSEPQKRVLQLEKIDIDTHKFSGDVEAYFSLFCESNDSTYDGNSNLNHLEGRTFLNSIVGGDALVILRYKNKKITVQTIDGGNVVSPLASSEMYGQATANGNIIFNGIEFNSEGERVAFYVKKIDVTKPLSFDIERIEAYGKSTGLAMAFMVVGFEYRIDSKRGIPLISAVMEKLKQMDRYQSATLGSAEERAKIPYFFEHEIASTGENPLINQLAKAWSTNPIQDDMPIDDLGNRMAERVAVTTNKSVFNLPQGVTVNSPDAKNELYFKDFFTINIDLVCASVEIPPNVAMSKYDSNFSASRAALKDWEHTLKVKRYKNSSQFKKPVYHFWLHIMILEGKIVAPGYLMAFRSGNTYVVNAYVAARFVGANVPHIDPLKEVMAEREKLGETGAALPLTTLEAATEAVDGGESSSNMDQYASELQLSKELKIELPPEPAVVPPIDKKAKKAIKKAAQLKLIKEK